jgi:hypothetical protein
VAFGPYTVEEGKVLVVPCAALVPKKSLHTQPYFVLEQTSGKAALSVPNIEEAQLLFPGKYRILYFLQNKSEKQKMEQTIEAGPDEIISVQIGQISPLEYKVQVQGLNASSLDGAVELRWEKSKDTGLAGYRIYRAEGKYPIHGQTPLKDLKYIDRGLTNDRAYQYIIRAVREDGVEGPPSPPVSVIPQKK